MNINRNIIHNIFICPSVPVMALCQMYAQKQNKRCCYYQVCCWYVWDFTIIVTQFAKSQVKMQRCSDRSIKNKWFFFLTSLWLKNMVYWTTSDGINNDKNNKQTRYFTLNPCPANLSAMRGKPPAQRSHTPGGATCPVSWRNLPPHWCCRPLSIFSLWR